MLEVVTIKIAIMGICQYPRIDNTFFTGNCFGSIMPFMGFGQFMAMLTGIYAGLDLCGQGNYEELTKPLRKSYENSLVLRRAYEKLDNSRLDSLVRKLNGPWSKLVFNSGHLDVMKVLSYILRPVAGKVHK